MRSATVGWVARRKDSVLPAQSWNSSQTRTGLGLFSTASAIARPAVSGSPRTAAIDAQNPKKSRREMPRCSSSCVRLGLIIGYLHHRASVHVADHIASTYLPNGTVEPKVRL